MSDKKKRLTVKQLKLINGVAEGKTIGQAAVDAGYGTNPSSASAIASETLKNPYVQEALDAALERQGLSLDNAAKAIKDGYNANKRDMADHGMRLKTAEIHLKAKRILGQSESPTVQNNFIGASSFEEFCRAYHRTRQQA